MKERMTFTNQILSLHNITEVGKGNMSFLHFFVIYRFIIFVFFQKLYACLTPNGVITIVDEKSESKKFSWLINLHLNRFYLALLNKLTGE